MRAFSTNRFAPKLTVALLLQGMSLWGTMFLFEAEAANIAESGAALHPSIFLQDQAADTEAADRQLRVYKYTAQEKTQRAQYFIKNDLLPDAVEAYQEVLEMEPANEKAELALAETYRRVHNDDAALETLKVARRQHPRNVAVLRALGNLEMEMQRFDAAIEAFRTAMRLTPANLDVRSLLATGYLKKGDSEAALRELNVVLSRDPANGLARFERAEIYADAGENEKALVDAEKVVRARPDYLPGRTLYAKVLVRVKNCERAVEILRPAENAPILDVDGLFLLAGAYDCAGDKELANGARGEFEKASREEHETSENRVQSLHLVEQANELAIQNKLAEALELLRQALEKNPQNAFAYSQQAKIYFSMRQPQQAREAIEKALRIMPYQPDFLFVQGVIAEGEGKSREALIAFSSVVHINPKEADAYYELGKILMKENNGIEALAAFRKAAKLSPDDREYQEAVKLAAEAQHRPE